MLNNDLLKAVWKKIDTIVDWVKITGKPVVGNALELADNWAGPYALILANEKFGDKIPAELVDNIEAALTGFINDDYELILASIPESINDIVDIKQFDDELEAAWFKVNFEAVISFIKYYAQKKSAE